MQDSKSFVIFDWSLIYQIIEIFVSVLRFLILLFSNRMGSPSAPPDVTATTALAAIKVTCVSHTFISEIKE